MSFVPKPVSRTISRAALKLSKNSPTLLVVTGVVGFGVTAVMAARASRKADPVIEQHVQRRNNIQSSTLDKRDSQKMKVELYSSTAAELVKVYGPTIVVGTISAGAILTGHRILKGRYVASMVAYSSLFDQFQIYRRRVANAVGNENERDLYEGAALEWQEDPNHKGEYKLGTRFDEDSKQQSYLRPWFDEGNPNWTSNSQYNYHFLKGVQQHANNKLIARGHVFLNEVLDALAMPRQSEAQITGWVYGGDGDDYIDFGFMTSQEPNTVAFRNQLERNVQLNFNIDGVIWDKI